MTSALKTDSVQAEADVLYTITRLLKHIKHEPLTEMEAGVRFLGITYVSTFEGNASALARLLLALDDALLFGHPSGGDQIAGLHYAIRERAPQREQMIYVGQRGAPAFHHRFAQERTRQDLILLQTHKASWLGEGNVPEHGRFTFAIGSQAVCWRQLLPFMNIPLASMREGKVIGAGLVQPRFEYEDTLELARACMLVYGRLDILDDSAIFMHDSKEV